MMSDIEDAEDYPGSETAIDVSDLRPTDEEESEPTTRTEKLILVGRRCMAFSWLSLALFLCTPLAIVAVLVSTHYAVSYEGDNVNAPAAYLLAGAAVTTFYYATSFTLAGLSSRRVGSHGALFVFVTVVNFVIYLAVAILAVVLCAHGPTHHSSYGTGVAYGLMSVASILDSAVMLVLVRVINHQTKKGRLPFLFGTVREEVFMNVADDLVDDLGYELGQLGDDRDAGIAQYHSVGGGMDGPDAGADDGEDGGDGTLRLPDLPSTRSLETSATVGEIDYAETGSEAAGSSFSYPPVGENAGSPGERPATVITDISAVAKTESDPISDYI